MTKRTFPSLNGIFGREAVLRGPVLDLDQIRRHPGAASLAAAAADSGLEMTARVGLRLQGQQGSEDLSTRNGTGGFSCSAGLSYSTTLLSPKPPVYPVFIISSLSSLIREKSGIGLAVGTISERRPSRPSFCRHSTAVHDPYGTGLERKSTAGDVAAAVGLYRET
ncbi:hypothetical protein GN956_G17394 [Arapaima gigas]